MTNLTSYLALPASACAPPSRPGRPDEETFLALDRALRGESDWTVRKRLLLEQTCRLVSAGQGLCVVVQIDEATARRTVVSVVHVETGSGGPRGRSSTRVTPGGNGSGTSSGADAIRRAVGMERCIDSFLPLRGLGVTAWMALGQPGGTGRFSQHQRELLDAIHSRSRWVYGPDLLLVSPDVLALTPRQRQILQLCLAGEGEKRIAAKLELSPNTVHHHVKAIYRHFGVASRGELLSRWVTENDWGTGGRLDGRNMGNRPASAHASELLR